MPYFCALAGFSTSTLGTPATSVTGTKSLTWSKGIFAYSDALIACVPTVPISSVWPSGAALATSAAPLLPPAPGLLSTMKGWPNAFCSSGASARARMSVVPPAAKGTTMRTGLLGQAWADANIGQAGTVATRRATRWRRRVMRCSGRLEGQRRVSAMPAARSLGAITVAPLARRGWR